jgi:hypothetical protein
MLRFLRWLFKTNTPARPKLVNGQWHYNGVTYPAEHKDRVENLYARDQHDAFCERAW